MNSGAVLLLLTAIIAAYRRLAAHPHTIITLGEPPSSYNNMLMP